MKKVLTLSMIVMIAVAATFTGCKKYDEGPTISLRSKKARVAGDWVYDKVLIDGQAGTLDADDLAEVLTIEKDGKGKFTNKSGSYAFDWEFGDKKETIKITSTYKDPITGATITSTMESDILKLKEKEFWIKHTANGHTSETHYKKK